ncbi:transporter substrate-binding domain-containing protein [Brachyspira alvinipulli]|uniref:transporter substrate-binding domain-containing protein n=1 Tax=Brachyspira alvinipulli TaxID=84379 RepID=UPI0004ACBDCC|nr:transporter substrate-binding domain-containing protein [Brachyspira alvinipulli]
MNKKLIILFSFIYLTIISCSGNTKETTENITDENIIRVASPGMHIMFSKANSEGKLEGYDIDVWEEIGKRLGKKIEWTQISMEGAFGSLESGKVDTVTQQISITPSRFEKYIFSEPYFLSPYKFFVASTNNSINKIEDLYGKKLGFHTGSSAHEYMKALDPEGKIEIVSFSPDSVATVPINVANGKIDAALEAVIIFPNLKESTGLDIKMVGDVVFTEVNAFPFRKDERGKRLCDEVSKTIIEMREDGTLEQLAVKWFGYNPMEGLDVNYELDKLLKTF